VVWEVIAATPPWLLALTAALAFALYTVVVERGMAVAAAAFYSTVIATVAFWILAVSRGIPAGAFTVTNLAPFVVAGVVYPALFRFLYYEGIDRIGASVSAAILGAYPALSAVLAVATLGEALPLLAGIGVVLVVAGVVLLQLTRTDEADGIEDLVATRLAAAGPRDFLYPLTAMVAVASAFVLIKYGLTGFPSPVTATAVTQTPALLVFGAWALSSATARRQLRLGNAAIGAFVVAGAFNVVGWLGQFFALQSGTVVTVVPLLNTVPLFVVGISYGRARQVPRSARVLGAVLAIVVGATLVQAV
jgi:drug/metabolite transporter (DMT)-like permease